ncbi:Uncharacterized conserved protein, DUF2147 family [Pseudooceanicola antarcticus]|uniref:DUF2147 domain-containing protein n=1 Tax=Pseudooceanicola antarcticus TaxID=1247613 RepID=A0A285JF40_9RHOB|nr:DUF2147 domain-containing protein [Pseudooceanicola antarcticus]PJE31031.1 DUF2147 domain-containing protein [Pseudooceanicola antarcticus]SNY58899.1 Uncharacterized conserved protein, DUF2147 family [Pseudooceanicola antarcticus]
MDEGMTGQKRPLLRHLPIAAALAMGCLMAAPAMAAETVLGTWASPPDRKGQTGYVVIRNCGAAYCGRLERAFSPQGEPIVTRAVGKMLLRDMEQVNPNAYEGRVYVPLIDKVVDAEVQVQGDELSVRGCAGLICNSQVWKRVE